MLTVLYKGTLLRMHLAIGVCSVLRCERLALDYMGGFCCACEFVEGVVRFFIYSLC